MILKEIPLASILSEHNFLSYKAMTIINERKKSDLREPKMIENHWLLSDAQEAFPVFGKLFHKEPCMLNSFH